MDITTIMSITMRNAMDIMSITMERVQAIIMNIMSITMEKGQAITMTTEKVRAITMTMSAAVMTMITGTNTTIITLTRYLPAGAVRRPGLMRESSWNRFWTSFPGKRNTALF